MWVILASMDDVEEAVPAVSLMESAS